MLVGETNLVYIIIYKIRKDYDNCLIIGSTTMESIGTQKKDITLQADGLQINKKRYF